MGQPLWDIIWRFLKKLNIEFSKDPVVPPLEIYPILLLGAYPKDFIRKRKESNRYLHMNVHSGTPPVSQEVGAQVSVHRWMENTDCGLRSRSPKDEYQ